MVARSSHADRVFTRRKQSRSRKERSCIVHHPRKTHLLLAPQAYTAVLASTFYWTGKDKTIWLIKSDGQPMRSSTSSVTSRTARATFYFEDDNGLNESSYKLRYTGSKYTNEESSSDKVTIKAEQIQDKPNDAEHIGTDGDCGTATATYVGMNKDNRRQLQLPS